MLSIVMIKLYTIVPLLICALLFCSCVTKKQVITISSTPNGAKVYVDGFEERHYIGTTPLEIKSRIVCDKFYLEKKGYYPKTIYTYHKRNINALWNFLIWTPLGPWFGFCDWPVPCRSYRIHNYSAELKPVQTAPKTAPKPAPVTEKKADPATLSRIARSNSGTEMKSNEIFRKYNSAVFMVYTSDRNGTYQGSGFFVSSDGIGISNYHVFKGTFNGQEVVKLSNGSQFKIKEVLAYSKKYDYIVFKVDGRGLNYIPVTTRGCEVGEKAYAIGSPRGLQNTISDGLVSQKHSGMLLQISVPIDHGSSGGPLINAYGEVIGITTGGRDDSHANLNFALDIRAIF